MLLAEPGWLGAVITAVISGASSFGLARLSGRQSRETQFDLFRQRVMDAVETREADCQKRLAVLEQSAARSYVVEVCLKMAIDEIELIAPESPSIRHIRVMLTKALPVHDETPDVLINLLAQIDARHGDDNG